MTGVRRLIHAKWYSAVATAIAEPLNTMEPRSGGSTPSALMERRAQVVEIIEDSVIPSLVKSYQTSHPTPSDATFDRPQESTSGAREIDAITVESFCSLLLENNAPAVAGFVDRLTAEGYSDESICLFLLTPAARYLGDLWVKDICNFSDVTLGLLLLHDVLRNLSHLESAVPRAVRDDASILLILPPGEQHIFGLCMVAEFFRKANWNVQVEFPEKMEQISDLARGSSASIVGLTCSSEVAAPTLTNVIDIVRRRIGNQCAQIMVGGHLFNENPHLADQVGADSSPVDGREAVRFAEQSIA